ncbi:hypothetical protein ScPMuIL_016387 [Solemya velum]
MRIGRIRVLMCVALLQMPAILFIITVNTQKRSTREGGLSPEKDDVTLKQRAPNITESQVIPHSTNKSEMQHKMTEQMTQQEFISASGYPLHSISHKDHLTLLAGRPRNKKVFLAMGLPTVKREGQNYLMQTIDSLLSSSTDAERSDVVLIIFLADLDIGWVNSTTNSIVQRYNTFLKSGFIQVVGTTPDIYPELEFTRRTFNDSKERVKWRSKQNIDYAHLFLYCRDISAFYIQLEDDIIAAPSFLKSIHQTVQTKAKTFWFCIRFSSLGFIGYMFHSKDLERIAEFLFMFYSEQPCDNLMGYLMRLMTQFQDIKIKPSLFQHKGVVSSLKGKKQLLTDRNFREQQHKQTHRSEMKHTKKFRTPNPDAVVTTNIEAYGSYVAESAYIAGDSIFWGKTPRAGDFYKIIFDKPHNVSRIYVKTGLGTKERDILREGLLKVSTSNNKTEPCGSPQTVSKFVSGKVDTLSLDSSLLLPFDIQCVVIEVTQNQTEWVIIREVDVFPLPDSKNPTGGNVK